MMGSTIQDRKKDTFSVARKISAVMIWIMIWQLLSLYINSELLIPAPLKVFQILGSLMIMKSFWVTVLFSVARVMEGFLIAVLIGTLLAVLTTVNKYVYDFFYPLISVMRSTPVASFIILALFWFSTSSVSIFAAFLIVMPVFWANVAIGIRSTDNKLLEMAKVFKIGIGKKFQSIYLPTVLPYFKSALITGLGMGWKAGIAAEVIGRPKSSIGDMIYRSKINLETSEMFAWTLVVIAISVILEKVLVYAINKAMRGYGGKNAV